MTNFAQNQVVAGVNHSFDVGVAMSFGLNSAIVFNHILYWLRVNASKRKTHLKEGKIWMYQTQDEIANSLGYLSEKEVKLAIKRLVDGGLLLSSKFNKIKFDNTNWYTVTDQSLIHVGLRNSKNLCEEPVGADPEDFEGPSEKTPEAPLSLYNTDTKQIKKPIYPFAVSPLRKKKEKPPAPPDKNEVAPNVRLSEDEHQKLKDKHGQDLARILKFYSDWKTSKMQADPKAAKAHTDYHRITKWAAQAALEESQKPQGSQAKPQTFEEQAKELASPFKHGELYNGAECFHDADGIAFQRGITHEQVKFKEFGFKDKFENILRKFGIFKK